ncbi:MAG: proline dehydrogenase family protein [Reichenbachiella sp.]
MNPKIDFDNTEIAFADKSNWDLRRMQFLFASMNNPTFSKVGILLTRVLLAVRFPIKWLVKRTIFRQFCGGESLQESLKTVDKLSASNIKTILDYSAEGERSEKVFDANKEEILRSLELAKESNDIPTGVMKLTGFCSFGLLAKKQAGRKFSPEQVKRFEAFEKRVEEICERAVAYEKFLFIDAEETWIQITIDDIVNRMMAKYNKDRVFIFNTYQMYLVDSLDKLKAIHEKGENEGFKIGAKLVRGAYMEKERERAVEKGYPDPVHSDKEGTDDAYNNAVQYCLSNIEEIALCAGTHNESSSLLVTELMEEHKINRDDHRVYLAQLFGMSDNISYNLADAGYNVAKYVPYGAVRKVLPYMMRRAEENTAIAGQSSREYNQVKKEIARRRKAGK